MNVRCPKSVMSLPVVKTPMVPLSVHVIMGSLVMDKPVHVSQYITFTSDDFFAIANMVHEVLGAYNDQLCELWI